MSKRSTSARHARPPTETASARGLRRRLRARAASIVETAPACDPLNLRVRAAPASARVRATSAVFVTSASALSRASLTRSAARMLRQVPVLVETAALRGLASCLTKPPLNLRVRDAWIVEAAPACGLARHSSARLRGASVVVVLSGRRARRA